MSMLTEVVELVIGVDTHTDTHTAAVVVAATAAVTETITVTADPAGYDDVLALAARHGGLRAFAVEGAGGYGAGLVRHLAAAGEVVVELDRPARAQLSRPKTGAQRGALAVLLTARRSAVQALETEASAHEKAIRALVAAWRPDLLELPGVGPINAATVLSAWSHPGRCRDDAAFAMLAGAAPIPASSLDGHPGPTASREAQDERFARFLAELHARQETAELPVDLDPPALVVALIGMCAAPVSFPHIARAVGLDIAAPGFAEHYATAITHLVARLCGEGGPGGDGEPTATPTAQA